MTNADDTHNVANTITSASGTPQDIFSMTALGP